MLRSAKSASSSSPVGMEPAVKDSLFERMRSFFALDRAAKQALAIGNSPCHRGYVGFGTEALEGALGGAEDAIGTAPTGDLKETLDTGTEHGPDHPEVLAGTPLHGPNQFPELPGFKSRYVGRLPGGGGGSGPADATRPRNGPRPGARVLRRPARRDDAPPPAGPLSTARPASTPEPGQLGCGAHTDYGTLTVLADDGVGRPPGAPALGRVDRRRDSQRPPRRQPRRSDGDLDERPVGVESPSRRQPAGRRPVFGGAVHHAPVPLPHRDPAHLSRSRRRIAPRAADGGALPALRASTALTPTATRCSDHPEGDFAVAGVLAQLFVASHVNV